MRNVISDARAYNHTKRLPQTFHTTLKGYILLRQRVGFEVSPSMGLQLSVSAVLFEWSKKVKHIRVECIECESSSCLVDSRSLMESHLFKDIPCAVSTSNEQSLLSKQAFDIGASHDSFRSNDLCSEVSGTAGSPDIADK